MLLTIKSEMFGDDAIATSGHIDIDSERKISRFFYPTDLSVGGHVDIVLWNENYENSVDFFWQVAKNGTISECEVRPFGDGSNRTPFFNLAILPGAIFIGEQQRKLQTVLCFYTQNSRNTTQCFTKSNGEPWYYESYYSGINIWEFSEIYDIVEFPPEKFKLPPCFNTSTILLK